MRKFYSWSHWLEYDANESKYPKNGYRIDQNPHRLALHKEFPYVLTLENDYYTFDDFDKLIWTELGPKHGECHADWCELSYQYDEIYQNHPLRKEFLRKNRKIIEQFSKANPTYMIGHETHPLKDEYRLVCDRVHDEMKNDINMYDDHSHKGIWTTKWLVKTGYDYGWQDYCFKNRRDLIWFKLTHL